MRVGARVRSGTKLANVEEPVGTERQANAKKSIGKEETVNVVKIVNIKGLVVICPKYQY